MNKQKTRSSKYDGKKSMDIDTKSARNENISIVQRDDKHGNSWQKQQQRL